MDKLQFLVLIIIKTAAEILRRPTHKILIASFEKWHSPSELFVIYFKRDSGKKRNTMSQKKLLTEKKIKAKLV